MKFKTTALRVKAVEGEEGLEEGQFLAYASVFGGPPDSYGDIVDQGAFAKSLAAWAEKGDPIPLLWGHDMHDPFSNIGHVVAAEEDEHGLKVHGQLDLENPTAMQVYRLIKGRRTTDLSFAYDVKDAEKTEDGNHLREVDIFEVSIVPIGANRLTDVLAVKHLSEHLVDGVKEGRVLAAKHIDSLRSAQEAIGVVIAAAEGEKTTHPGGTNDQEKANEAPAEVKVSASDEEPHGAKSSAAADDKAGAASVDLLATLIQIRARGGAEGGFQ